MSSEEFIIYIVPVVVFFVATAVSFLFGKLRAGWVLAVIALLWAGFTGAMFFGMEQASGWDGLGYALGLLVLSAPGAAGYVLGGIFGWWRGGKETHA